jgi:hypothetical protein
MVSQGRETAPTQAGEKAHAFRPPRERRPQQFVENDQGEWPSHSMMRGSRRQKSSSRSRSSLATRPPPPFPSPPSGRPPNRPRFVCARPILSWLCSVECSALCKHQAAGVSKGPASARSGPNDGPNEISEAGPMSDGGRKSDHVKKSLVWLSSTLSPGRFSQERGRADGLGCRGCTPRAVAGLRVGKMQGDEVPEDAPGSLRRRLGVQGAESRQQGREHMLHPGRVGR